MAWEAFVFDLDGTLWDSLPWYASLIGGGNEQQANRALERLTDGASIITLASGAGLSKALLARQCHSRISELRVYPCVSQTLKRLRQRGHKLGIVTSLSGDVATAMLRALAFTEYFGTVIHPGCCRSRKVTGIPLRRALDQMGVIEPLHAVYVGDREDDALCARNAGVEFCWASYGYGHRPKGQFRVVKEFREVVDL